MPSALSPQEVNDSIRALPGWVVENKTITRAFAFKNYYETMAFVNAIAWIAHGEDHHPDLEVGYNKCKVTYSTHSAGGLTTKDFDSARKVQALFSPAS
jgi:4a-hydroxytetrahydrobiopterin dehydratase